MATSPPFRRRSWGLVTHHSLPLSSLESYSSFLLFFSFSFKNWDGEGTGLPSCPSYLPLKLKAVSFTHRQGGRSRAGAVPVVYYSDCSAARHRHSDDRLAATVEEERTEVMMRTDDSVIDSPGQSSKKPHRQGCLLDRESKPVRD